MDEFLWVKLEKDEEQLIKMKSWAFDNIREDSIDG